MNNFKQTVFILIFSMLVSISAIGEYSTPPLGELTGEEHYDLPSWFKSSFLDISEDVDEAKDKKKHVLLFIHQEFCPYCAKMIKVGFAQEDNNITLREEFDVVAINIRGDKEVTINENLIMSEAQTAKFFDVRFTPTIIFLDQQNNEVYKLNGYRDPNSFNKVLNFVKGKSYKYMDLEDYIDTGTRIKRYSLIDNDIFESTIDADLRKLSAKKLMLIIEDEYCETCEKFHENTLSNKRISRLMSDFKVIRIDAESKEYITTPDGIKMTIKDYVKSLSITYRPAVILFDQHKEIARIDGLQYNYHFGEALRYVGKDYHIKFNGDYKAYILERTNQILSSGFNVNIGR